MTIAQLPPFDLRVVYPWMQHDAVFAAHFAQGQYWVDDAKGPIAASSLLTTTRSSGIVLPDSAGVFQALGNNVLPRTDRGLYVNKQFTNLVSRKNPTVAQLVSASGPVTNADGFAGQSNSLRFEGGSTARWAYLTPTISNGVPFAASFLIQMEDGNAPAFGNATGNHADNSFAIVVNSGTISPLTYVTEELSAGIYKVSVTGTTPASGANFGVVYFAANQDRSFRVCGYQLFAGTFVPETLVPGSSDTGGPTLMASDIRAAQGTRPSNAQPEPFPGWEAAGLDDAVAGKAVVNIDRLNASAARFIAGSGVDADNLWRLIFDTDNRFKLIVRKSGVDEVALQTGAVASTGDKTVEWQAKPGDYAIAATGVAGDTDSDGATLPAGATTLRVGSDFGVLDPFNGWVSEIQIARAA